MRDNVGKVIFISVGMIILVILGILILMTKKERDAQDTTYESFSWNTGVTTVATTNNIDSAGFSPNESLVIDETAETNPDTATVPTSAEVTFPYVTF